MVDIMDTIDPGTRSEVARPLPPRLEVTPGFQDGAAEFDSLPSKLSVRDLDFFYGKQQALYRQPPGDQGAPGHRHHRPVGLRQIDAPALLQPHLRALPRPEGDRRGRPRRREHPRPGHRPAQPAPARRDDLPETQPVPDDRVRQHRLRAAHAFQALQVGALRAGRGRAQARRPLGRGQEQAERTRPRPVGRSAAAALHRPGDRRRARAHPHGRALLGDRPCGHRQDRGARPGAQVVVHDRPRHPQHAAGGPRVRLHRLLLRGQDHRVRVDHPDLREPRPRSRPRSTSPAGSASEGLSCRHSCNAR